jgi:hypothetical protein
MKQFPENYPASKIDREFCCDECEYGDRVEAQTVSTVVIVAEERNDFFYYSEVFAAARILTDAAGELLCVAGGKSTYQHECKCANCELCGRMTRASEYLLAQARASVPWASQPVLSKPRPTIAVIGVNADTVSRF